MTKYGRRKFNASFKAKVAMEPVKKKKTFAELGKQFEVNKVRNLHLFPIIHSF